MWGVGAMLTGKRRSRVGRKAASVMFFRASLKDRFPHLLQGCTDG
jgi:hypothetical protein